jgi:hypothetical protein
MHPVHSRSPRRPIRRAAIALVAALTLGLGACGYRMESPQLPNNRHSIGVAAIRNFTYEAELDVRLQEALRQRLFRDPAIRVTPPDRSELVLTMEIKGLNIARARDLDSTDVRRLNLNVSGVMSVRDVNTGALIHDRTPVAADLRYDLPESALETPALRDDAIDSLLAVFADKVVDNLLLTF